MVGSHRNHTHIDEGALIWAKNKIEATSFLDIGCGPMGMIELALCHNLKAYGLDADTNLLYERIGKIPDRLFLTDFRYASLIMPIKFDIIWCIEVIEHVPKEYEHNLLNCCKANLSSKGLIIMTHGLPSTLGDSHVNCEEEEYWIEKFFDFGFKFKDDFTKELKEYSTMVREFIKNTGKVFTW